MATAGRPGRMVLLFFFFFTSWLCARGSTTVRRRRPRSDKNINTRANGPRSSSGGGGTGQPLTAVRLTAPREFHEPGKAGAVGPGR